MKFRTRNLGLIFAFFFLGTSQLRAADLVLKAEDISSQKTHPLEDYKDYEFLFVPGFLYDPLIELSQAPKIKNWHIAEYFTEMRQALVKAGVKERIAVMGAQDSIFDNGRDLAKILSEMKGPVIIISHSKGGLETLETLVEFRLLRSKVAAWISLQTPFTGSQIADIVYKNNYARSASKKLLEQCFKGSLRSLEELQTPVRGSYMYRNHAAIESLGKEIPITSVGSWVKPGTITKKAGVPGLQVLEQVMTFAGASANDGLVELSSARLPHSDWVQISEMDHGDPVMRFPGRHFDRVALLRFLLEAHHKRLVADKKP
jgi:triacylglycerol esterase/lipase EstA (alpha/beta hydrolase family)